MRRAETDDGMPGQDSFLDVIANMVGIVIILVMVTGVRAGKLSEAKRQAAFVRTGQDKTLVELNEQLQAARREFGKAKDDVEESANRIVGAYRECKLVDSQRVELEMLRAAVEQDIAERRARLDADRQGEFDVQRQIGECRIRLNELTQEQLSFVGRTANVEEIESTPTPIAQSDAVDDNAIHVRLYRGHAAIVPVAALQEEVYRTRGVDYLRRELSAHSAAADVYGPIDGFRMRLRVERYAEVMPGANPNAAMARAKHVVRGIFIPESDDLGLPLEQAILPGAPLARALRNRPSNRTAVVAWVYPDSYDELRVLKRALWEQGAPLAVWPLHDGQAIEFSSEGTKAAAQ